MGSLKEINNLIESEGKLPSIYTNNTWQRSVSAAIQRHCKDTKTYEGAEDLFYSVYGIGEGYWGLKSYKNNNDKANPIEQRAIEEVIKNKDINTTEKEEIVKARIGQGIFRRQLIEKYKHCIVTGIDDERLLIASHVKPWRSSNNHERLSSNNGLLLSPLYDKLFDLGLISFDKNSKLIISSMVSKDNIKRFNINNGITYMKDMDKELRGNLEYHNDVIFKK